MKPDGELAQHIRTKLRRVLHECNGNRERAAVRLGVGLRTLYRWLAKYDIGDKAPPLPASRGECHMCFYWTSDQETASIDAGWCRRYPPVITPGGTAFPLTNMGSWCGEYLETTPDA